MKRMALNGHGIHAPHCTDWRMVAVGQHHLVVVADGDQRTITLSAAITGSIVRTASFDTGTTLLLGPAMGEWGGLERIDTATGTVREVPRLDGPINGVRRNRTVRAA